MKAHSRVSRPGLAAIALGALLGAYTANASDEVVDEIVVYGTPAALVLDGASLRVDVKQHARAIGRSVRDGARREAARAPRRGRPGPHARLTAHVPPAAGGSRF